MARLLKPLGTIIRTIHSTRRPSIPNGINAGQLCPQCTSRSLAGSASSQSNGYNLRDSIKCDWFDWPSDHHQLHDNLYDPSDFLLYPNFLTSEEQVAMMDHCLTQLDKLYRPRWRNRRVTTTRVNDSLISGKFRSEQDYTFETGHFDEVISGYREMLLNQQNKTDPTLPLVEATLTRLQALMPSPTAGPLIHILHLSSEGKIDPHIDNLETSGSTIIGLSLGSTRVMLLGHQTARIESHLKVLLPPGSVYIQRDSVRYNLQHSIPSYALFKNQKIGGEQRLSLMLRDEPASDGKNKK